MRWLHGFGIGACLVLLPNLAIATYSPPLTRVRIDVDQLSHTPSIVYASERRTTPGTDLELTGFGAQYILQIERDFGFGVQLGAAVGAASVDGRVGGNAFFDGLPVETNGYWVGGQLRVYQMLWKSEVDEANERPSAITAFVNLRGLHYATSGDDQERADLRFFTLTGGVGAMAELSLSDYVSICPYAWLTPGVTARLDYTVRGREFDSHVGATLRNPLLVGVDVWIYPFPPNWQDHLSLSVLTSFIDTDGDDRTIAAIIGWTF